MLQEAPRQHAHQNHLDPPKRRPGTGRRPRSEAGPFPPDGAVRPDDRGREVVRLRFVDGLLRREIAERLGVTEFQVSRILKDELVRAHDETPGPRPQAA